MIEEVRKINIKFKKWSGKPIENTMGNKEVLDINGKPLFAELAYLRGLEKDGWEGVWINNWGGVKYRNKMPFEQPEGTKIPDGKIKLLEKLWEKNGGKGGTWDIFAWKGNKILFAELKSPKDEIRNNQIKFYDAALDLGFSNEDFVKVEWEGL